MKRFLVRSSLVTGVVAAGLLAYYAQAQRGQETPAVAAKESKVEIATPRGMPQPIKTAKPIATQTADPFAASALSAKVLNSSADPNAGMVRHASAELPIGTAPARSAAPAKLKSQGTAARPLAKSPTSGTPYNRLRKNNKVASTAYQPPAGSYAPPAARSEQAYTPPSPAPAALAADTSAKPVATPITAYPKNDTPAKAAAPGFDLPPAAMVKTPAPAQAAEPAPLPGPSPAPAKVAATPYKPADNYTAPAPLPAADPSTARLGTELPGTTPPTRAPRAAAPKPYAQPVPAASTYGDVRGSGRPGSKQLEGTQSPQLQLRKKAPDEIQVGKPANFQVYVRNNGSAAAHDVRITDQVPEGTRLLSSKPQAKVSGNSLVTWTLGTLEPGEEKSVTLQVMPEAEGEIGSVASVEFRAEAGARTIATRPQLKLEMSAPKQVLIGEDVVVTLQISNPGTGVATGITLYNNLPSQLKHEAGSELEFDVGDLAPRESRQIELTLSAAGAGRLTNLVEARGDGSLSSQAQFGLEVIAPELRVALDGPKRRFLERRAVYALSISNAGTAPAEEVELVSHLPKGMEFVSANNAGHYDEGTHAVYWSLAELPEGETGAVELVTMPTEPGRHKIVVEGTAARDLSDQLEETIAVDGLAALVFEVVDVQDPVEVGSEAEYEIRVLNQGTKSASNLMLTAQLPAGLRAMSAEGPTRGSIEGSRVVFEPLNRLAPKADTTFRIRAEGLQAGDQRIRIQLQSDDQRQPVTKEESTLIYSDR